ncbi:hypothetical protein N8H72_18335 [Pseudomonas koreensis]|uniref:hypothetical protein n=1 Tax=Pseudomonas koreensis TaxID=198620 RepID=UPI0021C63F6B|nr:hypothetical protein [Pseudomonas koreensis]MCU0091938.1 hypothetical protein [Pseudomonas koreensis]
MKYQEQLENFRIAISTSESADMDMLGLSDAHLKDATVEIARHMLALGAGIAYGGDLRKNGFSTLLYELVARHKRDSRDGHDQIGIFSYLGWPVHSSLKVEEIEEMADALSGIAELVLLNRKGDRICADESLQVAPTILSESDWSEGLTNMRRTMLAESQARIVLGGRTENYKGRMPGIAEEALFSLQTQQPLYLVGGFGGCALDIAQSLGLSSLPNNSHPNWPGYEEFQNFASINLNNGLTLEENKILAKTPHVDQAVILIMRGLLNAI